MLLSIRIYVSTIIFILLLFVQFGDFPCFAVIYGMVNFWSSAFFLPKRFYEKIDSLCSAFLCSNTTTSAAGARVAWSSVCKPKQEGGLGIRMLAEFELVFRLKQVWNLFANVGSLWVAWLKGNVFHRKSYWITEESPSQSKTVRMHAATETEVYWVHAL